MERNYSEIAKLNDYFRSLAYFQKVSSKIPYSTSI